MGKENIGIILAGGVGVRMAADGPKQYIKVNGKELLAYSIDSFELSKRMDAYVVVVNNDSDALEYVKAEYQGNIVAGGETRNESFKRALDYIYNNFCDCIKIFVNEAARPMLTPEIIDDYFRLLDEYDYVFSAAHITDSLSRMGTQYANRTDYVLCRSPEGYIFRQIYKYFSKDTYTTFPGHTLPKKKRGYPYFEYRDNIKVTYSEDIVIVGSLLKDRFSSTIRKEL